MQLTNFFSTLNLQNIAIFTIVFLIFDSLGLYIAKIFEAPTFLRLTYWVWGMCLFSLQLFLLHLFLPFKAEYIFILLLLSAIISISNYIKNRGLSTLIKVILKFPYPLFVLLILIKPLYFLISAPPYYADEMNYQFYSPNRLTIETHWPFIDSIGSAFGPSIYEMIPKSLNTAYWALFSLTKTYSTARLLHLLIVFSVIYTISIILKKFLNIWAAILFSVFALLSSSYFIQFATLGYVDAAPAILAVLFLILITQFIQKPTREKLFSSAIILGLMVGMKYTISVFAVTILLSGIMIMIYKNHKKVFISPIYKLIKLFKKQKINVITTLWLIVVFGGYWYIKNLLISGNPIYPLFFKCFHGWQCGLGSSFFSGWTYPFDIKHYWLIVMSLFQSSAGFYYSVVITIFLSLIYSLKTKNKTIQVISTLIILSVSLEIIISRNITGFELRYYFHWVLLIPLILILPLAFLSKKSKIILLSIIILYIFPAGIIIKNIKRFYEGDYVPGFVRNYAMHRININNWLDYYYPQMSVFIKWCGSKKPVQNIILIDPNLIWYSEEGGMRAFLVNCNLAFPPIPTSYRADKISSVIKENHPNSYLISLERCHSLLIDKTFMKDFSVRLRYDVNQNLICGSKEVVKNMYQLTK